MLRFSSEKEGLSYTADKKIWFPNTQYATPKDGESPQEALERLWQNRLADAAIVISLLATKKDELELDVSLDDDGAKALADHLNKLAKKYPDTKFNLAVEEQDNGWTSVARFSFIELHEEGKAPGISVKVNTKDKEEDSNDGGSAQKLF